MKDFDRSLLEGGNIFKESYSALMGNLCKIIATITALIAVLITFTDITFASVQAKDLTSVLILLVMAGYIIYFSLEEAGEKLGEESDEYKNSLAQYNSLKEKISSDKISELREFTKKYALAEAEYRRQNELLRFGYSDKEYELYLEGATVSREAKNAFKRVDKIKPVPISCALLLSKERTRKGSELCNPERGKYLKMALRLIPSTLCMLITVSVVFSTKNGLGIEDVFEGIMKLSTLPIIAIRGYLAGFSYTRETRTAWLDTRSRLLKSFLDLTD